MTEVRERLDAAEAAILTEYRGLTVAEMAELRRACATRGRRLQGLQEHPGQAGDSRREARGPRAAARGADGDRLRDGRGERRRPRRCATTPGPIPNLVSRAACTARASCSAQDLGVLAELPPRDVLLAQLAGAIAAPLQQMAGLLQALPRNFAYGLVRPARPAGGAPAEAAARRGPRGSRSPRPPKAAGRGSPSRRSPGRGSPGRAKSEPPKPRCAEARGRGQPPPRPPAEAEAAAEPGPAEGDRSTRPEIPEPIEHIQRSRATMAEKTSPRTRSSTGSPT